MGSCQVDLGRLSLLFETRQSSFLTDMQVLIDLKEQILVKLGCTTKYSESNWDFSHQIIWRISHETWWRKVSENSELLLA